MEGRNFLEFMQGRNVLKFVTSTLFLRKTRTTTTCLHAPHAYNLARLPQVRAARVLKKKSTCVDAPFTNSLDLSRTGTQCKDSVNVHAKNPNFTKKTNYNKENSNIDNLLPPRKSSSKKITS
jgi:hypothetical protein